MLLAGARRNTAKELSTLLHVWSGDSIRQQLHDFLSGLPDEDSVFRVANRLYSASHFEVRREYAEQLSSYYQAEIKSVDFEREHRAITREVNEWVSNITESKIRHVLFPGSIDAYTTLTLISVVYLKAPWLLPFDERLTTFGDFYVKRYNRIEVDMMHLENAFKIGRSDELRCSALEMDYKGGRFSMVILLPDEVDGLTSLEEQVTAYTLDSLFSGLEIVSDVMLSLPKFKVDRKIFLHHVLKRLGLNDTFAEGTADLSGIFRNGSPAISIAIHQALVHVNENGTGAPAAEGSIYSPAFRRRSSPIKFTVDHPFMFLIKTSLEDVILFMGSVRNPQ
ncbi:hypothetical protein V5799_005908 [Amblyomma americanum]|uniref:Serpin domain-containing protein n=1 Tax=Amblyomma americanum TaxID=6943 RepID=A0AAQ4DXW3_AMBAM